MGFGQEQHFSATLATLLCDGLWVLRGVGLCICVMLTESPGNKLRKPSARVIQTVVQYDRLSRSGLAAPGWAVR